MAVTREITIPVRLDAKTFRRFACFDILIRKKRWVRPLVFALILIGFAIVALLSWKSEAGMISAVLLVVGCGLPVVYFGMFLTQVNLQAERQKLGKGKAVYIVTLRDQEIRVVNSRKKEESVSIPWKDADRAYRSHSCIYLYVTPQRAFLLPSGQADAPDEEVWGTILRGLGREKCRKVL
ncbi:MAG: YcxB family protein [Clostridia bacterium]|nr:YcxB family protein [Clostridia bacterium]